MLSVIIPVKNLIDLTQKVIRRLRLLGGYDRIIVFDNGSNDGTWSWLNRQTDVIALPSDKGIYAMWNAGRRIAKGHCAILNNDIDFDHGFLQGLEKVLEDESVGAVSPNPEGNPLTDVVASNDWLCGYAFVVRAGMPPFDEGYRWYYGDDDYVQLIHRAGYQTVMHHGIQIRHIGRASTPPGLVEATVEADAARYREKWSA